MQRDPWLAKICELLTIRDPADTQWEAAALTKERSPHIQQVLDSPRLMERLVRFLHAEHGPVLQVRHSM